ncbi:protein of unknown function DUF3668 [Trinorchestia longiramus]|nr:protein of unknown function DUF3668 [Trinorchestia longiramus]
MKDKNSPGEAASACKGQAEQNLEQSNYSSSDCGMTCSASPSQQFPETSDADVDLYDDIEPKESLGSNGQSTQQCSTDPLQPPDEYIPENHERKLIEETSAAAVQKPAMAEVFSQLVSDTLNDPEVDGAVGPADAAPSDFCTVQQSFSSVSNVDLPLSSGANGTSCNGNEESAKVLQYQQSELVFKAGSMDSCSTNPTTHMHSRFESEENDEDVDESDGSTEFDEEDCKAALAEHRKKAAMNRQKKDQSGDSSIMVLDSDEEGECDDDMDGEELEEEEEEEMLEEEEEGEPEDYDGDEHGHEESSYSPDQSFRSHEKSKQSYSAYGTSVPPQQVPESNSMKVTSQKQVKNLNGQQMLLNGRDHESIMKKIRFNQEISMMRRTESHNMTEDVKDMETFNEEDGWQELVKWNEMREEEKALGAKDNNSIDDHSRLSAPDFKQASGKDLPAIINRTENVGNLESRTLLKSAPSESTSNVSHSILSESTRVKPDSHSQSEIGRQESKVVCSTHFTSSQENETSEKPEEATIASAPTESGSKLPPPMVAQLNQTKGYFEIGSCRGDPNLAMYNLSTTIIFAKQLGKVIPGTLLRSCKDGPHFQYSLLGCPVHTDPIVKLGECEFPGERANARVMTTASNMALYLRQHSSLTVSLLIGEIELAQCSIDLLPLVLEGSQTKSKVEGSYNLIPVKGNVFGSASAGNAVVGVSVELEQTSQPCVSNMNDSISGAAQNDTQEKLKRVMNHLSEVSVEYDSLNAKRNKRERESSIGSDHINMESSDAREDSVAMSASRQLVREHFKPPLKKRKLAELMGEKSLVSEDQTKNLDSNWAAAEEDLQQWRQAQENIFWKQWMVREKKLQESLSEEWKERMAGLEDELMEQLHQVEQERAALENEWRSLRERETGVRRKEEQLLQLQQEVLEQQAALGSQLQLGFTNKRPLESVERLRPITSHLEERRADTTSSNKEYYKRQWLRGVATTHRRWTEGLPSTSSAGTPPSASSCSGRVFKPRSADKYDSEIFDELTRLTKERRHLLATHALDSPQVLQLDSDLERLMAASGV